jgi:hypothetical protein
LSPLRLLKERILNRHAAEFPPMLQIFSEQHAATDIGDDAFDSGRVRMMSPRSPIARSNGSACGLTLRGVVVVPTPISRLSLQIYVTQFAKQCMHPISCPEPACRYLLRARRR